MLAVFVQEVFQEYRNLFTPFSQRRNMNGDYIQAIKQIFAEDSFLYSFFQGLLVAARTLTST
jgi:hypothetical protein